MDLNRRSFLTGLMTAIPLLSTIKFGATEVVELVPKNDKFRELLFRTTEVKNAYTGPEVVDSKEYNDSWRNLLSHINNEFDHTTVTSQEVNDIFSNKMSIFEENSLLSYSEGSHPIAAVRELLWNNKLIICPNNLSSTWSVFSNNYAPLILKRILPAYP